MNLPFCYEHKDPIRHPPVLCRTEHVWHPLVCPHKEKVREAVARGMNDGHLSDEERARRAAKNARNASRRGNATRQRGSQRRGR